MGKLYAKEPFCSNPKYSLHQQQVYPNVMTALVTTPGILLGTTNTKEVKRQVFLSADKKRRAFFCEVCESAIDTAYQVVGEPEPEK